MAFLTHASWRLVCIVSNLILLFSFNSFETIFLLHSNEIIIVNFEWENWRRIEMKNVVRIRIESHNEKERERKTNSFHCKYVEAKEIEKRLRA